MRNIMNTLAATKSVALEATKSYKLVHNLMLRAFTLFYDFLDAVLIRTYKVLILIAWVGIGVVIYWEFIDTSNPITKMVYSDPVFFTPVGSTIPNGIQYSKNFCFNKAVTLVVFPSLSNSIIYNVPSRGVLYYKAGCGIQHIDLLVPPEFNNGVYHYKAMYEIQVNPMRSIRHQYNVFTLTIIDAAHGKYKVSFDKNP